MIRLAYSYSCLMVQLPDVLARDIQDFARSIPPEFLKEEEGESGVDGDVHVTVKYGLHTTDPNEVSSVLSGVMPFRMRLGRIRSFHNRDTIVLKSRVESPELIVLNKLINKNFEHTDTHFDYRPHVTVAYLNVDDKDPYYYQQFCTDQFDGAEFWAYSVVFSTPDGEKTQIPLNGTRAKIASRII